MLLMLHYIMSVCICILFIFQCGIMNYNGCEHLKRAGEFTDDSCSRLYKIMFTSSWFWCLVMVICIFTLAGRAILIGGIPNWMVVFLVVAYLYSIGHMGFQYGALNIAIRRIKNDDI